MAETQYKDIDLKGYLDLNKNELRNARLQQLGADPGSPVEGQTFWRSDLHVPRLYNGTIFTNLLAADLLTSKGALITATGTNAAVSKATGANGTFLQAQSGQTDGLLWTTISDSDLPSSITRDTEVFLLSAYTTKGDIGIATGASTVARHGVGANGTFLVANSAQADGWENRAITNADIAEKLATNDLTDWPRVAALDLNNQKITNLADGTNTSDAVTFGQFSAVLQAQTWKNPVEAATTASINLATNGLTAIDGYTPVAGDRILVKNQATASQNGVYNAAVGAWTRAIDLDAAIEFKDATVLVLNGTTNAGRIFTQTATVSTVGTDTVTFVQTSTTGITYTADESTLHLTGTVFSIKSGGVTNTEVSASAAIAYSKLNLAGSIVNADIATGAAIAYSKLNLTGAILAADIAAGAGIPYSKLDSSLLRKFAAAITGGATSEVVTHNLNTRDIGNVTLINNASPYDRVGVEWAATTVNTITLNSPVNLPAGYRVVVTG